MDCGGSLSSRTGLHSPSAKTRCLLFGVLAAAAAAATATMAAAQEKLLASYRKAVAEHQEGNLDAALKSYRECLALQPIPAVHNNVAAIQLSQGHKRAAEESWRQAVSLKPDYAEAHYNLAVLLSESGQEGSLEEAASHCELALAHKDGYVQAHHLMGNIRMSQGGVDDAATWYARAEKLAGESAGAGAATGAAPARGSAAADASEFRWEGVEVGHVRRLQLPDGTSWTMETLSLRPLSFLVRDFLSDAECTRLVELALPQLKTSLVMGNATASERTSESVFLGAAEDELLPELQRRLAALAQLPLGRVQASEDLQVVHYTEGATFGMHHDSSSFLPRVLTAFYYLNDVAEGGETAFPAADNAMAPDDALKLTEPASSGGLVVKPQRGAALV